MRPTRAAINPKRLQAPFLLILALGGITFVPTNALGQIVLDGTVRVPKDQDMPTTGVITFAVRGDAIHPVLPLEVTIRDLNPASASLGDWLTVSVLIRNTGKDPLEIPCSRNFARIFKPGNKDQRDLAVSVSFVSAIGTVSMTAAVFAGSASVPGSMCSLAPQGTALVLGRMQAYRNLLEDTRLLNTTLDFRVKVSEFYYAEDENKVINASQDCISVNTASVFWHAPPPR